MQDGHAAGGNPLDVALWDAPAAARDKAALARYRRLGTLPFDHERAAVSVLVEDNAGHRMIITKGAPERLLGRCAQVPAAGGRCESAKRAPRKSAASPCDSPGGTR